MADTNTDTLVPLDDAFHVPDASARGFVDAYFGPVDLGHAARDRAFQRVAERTSMPTTLQCGHGVCLSRSTTAVQSSSLR